MRAQGSPWDRGLEDPRVGYLTGKFCPVQSKNFAFEFLTQLLSLHVVKEEPDLRLRYLLLIIELELIDLFLRIAANVATY